MTTAFFANAALCRGTRHGYGERTLAVPRVVHWSSESDPTERPRAMIHKAGTHIPTENRRRKTVHSETAAPTEAIARATHTNQGLTRAIEDSTERQVDATIGHHSSVSKWLLCHAALRMTIFHVRNDGIRRTNASEANHSYSKSLPPVERTLF